MAHSSYHLTGAAVKRREELKVTNVFALEPGSTLCARNGDVEPAILIRPTIRAFNGLSGGSIRYCAGRLLCR